MQATYHCVNAAPTAMHENEQITRARDLLVRNSDRAASVALYYSSPDGSPERAIEWHLYYSQGGIFGPRKGLYMGAFMSAHAVLRDLLDSFLTVPLGPNKLRKLLYTDDPLIREIAMSMNALDEWAHPFMRRKCGGRAARCTPTLAHYRWAQASGVRVSDRATFMRGLADFYGWPLLSPIAVCDFPLDKVRKQFAEAEQILQSKDKDTYPSGMLDKLHGNFLPWDELVDVSWEVYQALPLDRHLFHEAVAQEVGVAEGLAFFILLLFSYHGVATRHRYFRYSRLRMYETKEELVADLPVVLSFLCAEEDSPSRVHPLLLGEPETLRWEAQVTAVRTGKVRGSVTTLSKHWPASQVRAALRKLVKKDLPVPSRRAARRAGRRASIR